MNPLHSLLAVVGEPLFGSIWLARATAARLAPTVEARMQPWSLESRRRTYSSRKVC